MQVNGAEGWNNKMYNWTLSSSQGKYFVWKIIWTCLTFEGNSNFNFMKYVSVCFIRSRQAYYHWKTLLAFVFFFFSIPPPLFSWLKGEFPSKPVFFCIWSTVRSYFMKLKLLLPSNLGWKLFKRQKEKMVALGMYRKKKIFPKGPDY